jgi:O-antigen/teichoic acid export membrane protein
VLLVVSANVAAGTAFSIFGGVINGFQRYDLNNVVGAVSSALVALVNVLVLSAGYGLIELVVATTIVRVLTYWLYRANAYRVFPDLRLRLQSFSRGRLKEVTSFSVYMLLIDSATRLNYAIDALVVGVFLNTGAVALWSVSQRLAETTHRLTNQLNDVLFPNVVDNDTASRLDRLQRILLVGTRFSLATVVPLAGTLMLLAHPLLRAWVGNSFTDEELRQGAVVLQVMALAVLVRIGSATSGTVLKGAGRHRLVALCSVATSVANLSLSVVLIGPFHLAGVALGALVPASLGAMLVLFPAGCRRVELPLGRALAEAVWPAVWPGAVMAASVLLTRPLWGASLPDVGAEACVALAVYAMTFLRFGVSPAERRFCLSLALTLTGRPRLAETASEGA